MAKNSADFQLPTKLIGFTKLPNFANGEQPHKQFIMMACEAK